MSPVPDTRTTLSVDIERLDFLFDRARLTTRDAQARRIGVTRGHLHRVRRGACAPGPEFIAGVRVAFPDADIEALFPVVSKEA